jgi:hypothetical protein
MYNNIIKHSITEHNQYTWSIDYHEKISQLYFQLLRKPDFHIIEEELSNMIELFSNYKNTKTSNITYLVSLYKMIAHTRDIIHGKGEKDLSYLLIYIWNKYYPELAKYALKSFVEYPSNIPYGSWADIKYFSLFILNKTNNKKHPLILYACELIIKQLKNDYTRYLQNKPISLASKWCPREKSKFKWLFNTLAKLWDSTIINNCKKYTPKNNNKYNESIRKTRQIFRNVLSSLNKYIKTTEIYMCSKSNHWNNIEFNNVPSNCLHKYTNAFLNITNYDKERKHDNYIKTEDRIKTRQNLISFIENNNIHSKNLFPYQIVKDVIELQYLNKNPNIQKITQLKWDTISKQLNTLKNFIPIADLSYTMNLSYTMKNKISLNSYYSSIALSILISENNNNKYKNRILTFSENPKWINLDKCNNIIEKINLLNNSKSGYKTNLYGCFNIILNTILDNNIKPEDVENMTFVILTNSNYDKHKYLDDTLYNNIELLYKNTGLNSIFKKPYKPPHIVFWNLSYSNYFPVTSRTRNTTMVSGFSHLVLNNYTYDGIDGLKQYTPYKMIHDILNDKRYNILGNYALDYFQNNIIKSL